MTITRTLALRGAALLTALTASAALTIGMTTALFSDSETSNANTFTAGTVTVGLGSESVTCEVAQVMPGDSSAGWSGGSNDLDTCVYDVTYTGDAPAWLAVDVLVEGGSPSLYTGDSDGFQMLLTNDDSIEFVNGVEYLDASGSATTVIGGTSVEDLLVSATPASQGDAVRFDLNHLLPTAAPNALQGGSVSVTLTFHAVQSDNQPIGACVAGRVCESIIWG
ncbi:MAG: TasA family protein [Actinomycetota bacterium]|jgi:predicted ribosomally synthesized peptide with SipW-like signal peptide|nr:TasA family protein [Actinomycetota bacterium]